jgi:thiol-disulfide isomerase/thioredoxin
VTRAAHKALAGAWLCAVLACPALAAGDAPQAFTRDSLRTILDARAGQAFILGFWSLNCSHCREELTLLGDMARKHPRLPVVLVSTDSPEDAAAIHAALNEYSLEGRETWVFADPDSERLRYQIDRRWYGELPRTYLYEADGTATAVSGRLDAGRLEDWVRAHPVQD